MSEDLSDGRPLSPHLGVWKWHPTMASSILHRLSGVVIYIGVLKLCIILFLLAIGSALPGKFEPLLFSPVGVFAIFVFLWALIYHFFNGLRHLVWDMGKGFNPKAANTWSIVIVLASLVVTAFLVWRLVGGMQ